ncbi:Cytochrome P450 71A6 [Dendrobium catenatum]|uniref:Cytochrome P450 71A6 n=1 Tax=Dendrobium catenatum TaxID=906689 RepID=A0A2I0X976_9ASPA|nr:Cytochrome P450 71A6 [Dendrobium catenatum]
MRHSVVLNVRSQDITGFQLILWRSDWRSVDLQVNEISIGFRLYLSRPHAFCFGELDEGVDAGELNPLGSGHNRNLIVSFGGETPGLEGTGYNHLSAVPFSATFTVVPSGGGIQLNSGSERVSPRKAKLAAATNDGHLLHIGEDGVPAKHGERAAVEIAGDEDKIHGHEESGLLLQGESVNSLRVGKSLEFRSGPSVRGSSIMTYDTWRCSNDKRNMTYDGLYTSKVGTKLSFNNSNISFTQYGENWRQARKLYVVELLSPRRVRSFQSIQEQEVEMLCNAITDLSSSNSSSINLSEMVFALSYNVLCRVVFGGKLGGGAGVYQGRRSWFHGTMPETHDGLYTSFTRTKGRRRADKRSGRIEGEGGFRW